MALEATYLLNVLFLSVAFILALERIAPRLGMIDMPSGRKMHSRPVPVIGGVAMFAALLLVNLMLDSAQRVPADLLVGLAILVITGLIDDRYGMRAIPKLIAQLVAACVLTIPHGTFLTGLGNLFNSGEIELGSLALPFTLILIVGLINAYNMFDGIDGLAGGASAAALFWLTVMAMSCGRSRLAVVALLFLFGTIGFLFFNLRHPWCKQARVFLGDAGSMMLGASIAVLVVRLSGNAADNVPFAAVLWVCALPAIDTVSLFVRRLGSGQSPFAADRNHLHHLLLEAGMNPRQVAELLIALCFVLGGLGFAGAVLKIPSGVMAFGLLVPLALHTVFVHSLHSRRQALRTRAATAAASGVHAETRGR